MNKQASQLTFLLALSSTGAWAANDSGYLMTEGGQPVRSEASKVCIRASHWERDLAIDSCEGAKPTRGKTAKAKPVAAPRVITIAPPTFGFNESSLEGEAEAQLSREAPALKRSPSEIRVTGYADEIGTPAANLRLSEERAEAVKGFLVSKGVPATKIRTEARGESAPVTGDKCAQLQGESRVACLRDDRRVEIQAR